MSNETWTPVTHQDCGDVAGPFYHGTRIQLQPGNPTRSYRMRDGLRIVEEVTDWEGHAPEAIRQMLGHLEELRRAGRAVIED